MQQQQGQTGPASNGVAGGAQVPTGGSISPPQPSPATGTTAGANRAQVNGGRFDFDDGGTYCGGWEDGKAHGHGVCTGPKGQGAYSGSWHYGFEVSGVYTWPSGSAYEGQWQNGKRHGLGMEMRGRWLYRGEWTQGYKGRYGVRQSTTSTARYEGTWASGLQDGYGSETYADSGTYQGQWLRGMRHGYGVRTSAPFGLASHYKLPKQQLRASLTSLRSADGASVTAPTPEPTDRRDRRVDDSRGGFVLKARSDDPPARRKSLNEKSLKKGLLSGLKIRKQRSTSDLETRGTGGSIRSNASSASWMSTESSQSQASASVHTDSNASFVIEDEQMDASVTETYLGEWKNDKRTGFGISERSDGLRYEGEWFNNRKYGYGVTTFRDGNKEEGKYKNNVLITSQKKKQLFLMRSAKFRERIEAAVNAAQRSSKMALQKADIAISRTATARGKAELADIAAEHARQDSDLAQQTAKQFAPDFRQPGLERLKNREIPKYVPPPQDAMPSKSILSKANNPSSVDQTPVKSANDVTNMAPTPQSISQSVNQAIRRASMRPAHNQGNNPGGMMQNQIGWNSGLPNAFNSQPPNHLMNSLPTQYDYGGASGDSGRQFGQSGGNTSTGASQYKPLDKPLGFVQGQYDNVNSQGAMQSYQNQYPPNYPNTQIPIQSPAMYETMIESTSNQFTSNFYGSPSMSSQYGPGQNSYNPQMYGQQPMNPQQQSPQQQQQQQQQQQHMQQMQYQPDPTSMDTQRAPMAASIRRNSRILNQQDRPAAGIGQTLNDRLDHYKRPPSRDSSVDRYRVPTRLIGSRQPSVDKSMTSQDGADRSASNSRTTRGASLMRSGTPLNGSAFGSGAATPVYTPPTSSQFETAFKSRGVGQEIIPSGSQPKRTESLYVTPARGSGISGGGGSGGGGGGGGGIRDTSRTVPAFAATTQGRATL